jgi:hypothetical protein
MRPRSDMSAREISLLGNAPTIEPGQEPAIGWLAQAARGDFSPDKAVNDQLSGLDGWATTTEEQALRATARFWALKGPAFLCAVGASVCESFGYGRFVIVLGALAAIAIAVDAAWSGPNNPLLERAVRDIRNLQNSVKLRWDKVRISHPDAKDPARTAEALAILDAVESKREEIGTYLSNPASSPH